MSTMTEDIIDISRALNESLARTEVQAPPPGIYRNVSADEYHAWDACSGSLLKEFAKSPAHMMAALRSPKDTDALTFGTACHFAVLQRDEFAAKYVRGIAGDGRTKAVKDARAHLAVENPGKVVLSGGDYDEIMRMRDAIFAHPAASFTLSQAECELSLRWDDAETGVPCKARIDLLSHELASTIEIKTTKNAAVHGFDREIFNWGYYIQAAFYHRACREFPELAGVNAHIIIAAEKGAPPNPCNAFTLRGDAIGAGESEIAKLLPRYAHCLATGEWPLEGPEYSTSFTDISLPPWSWREIDERIAS